MEWRLQAIRGATTATENTVEAITAAVTELLNETEARNQLDPVKIVSVTFSVTRDLDAIFPAAIARHRPYWDCVPMLDVQQMHVVGSLQRCIRFLILVNIPTNHNKVCHTYLREAQNLRPDWNLSQPQLFSPSPIG